MTTPQRHDHSSPGTGGEQIGNGVGMGMPDDFADVDLDFDIWRVPSEDRPTLVQLRVQVVTDGVEHGRIWIEVDASEEQDYTKVWSFVAHADNNWDAATANHENVTFFVFPGHRYHVLNLDDPNNANQLRSTYEFTL